MLAIERTPLAGVLGPCVGSAGGVRKAAPVCGLSASALSRILAEKFGQISEQTRDGLRRLVLQHNRAGLDRFDACFKTADAPWAYEERLEMRATIYAWVAAAGMPRAQAEQAGARMRKLTTFARTDPDLADEWRNFQAEVLKRTQSWGRLRCAWGRILCGLLELATEDGAEIDWTELDHISARAKHLLRSYIRAGLRQERRLLEAVDLVIAADPILRGRRKSGSGAKMVIRGGAVLAVQ